MDNIDPVNLRDAPQEYSTVPFDMEPEILPEESSVPLNKTSKNIINLSLPKLVSNLSIFQL